MSSSERERVAIIGLGPLAREALAALAEHGADRIVVVGALDRDPDRRADADALGIPLVASVAELLALDPTVVLELAGHGAVREHVPTVLRHGTDVIVTSLGALADDGLRAELAAAATEGRATASIPSGAIGGLDAIAAARLIGIDSVTHTIRKHPTSLLDIEGARAVIDGTGLSELFRGPARDAIARYPAATNVTAALSIAGAGFDRTEVTVVADVAAIRNQHRIEARGPFGSIVVEMENERVPGSTSGAIVVASVVAAVIRRSSAISVG